MPNPSFDGHQFVTRAGCTISVGTAPHIGTGLLLSLDMKGPNDGRHAEVYLDRVDIAALRNALEEMAAR